MNLSPATLALAAAVTAPALYQGFVTEQLDVETALWRYLLAVVVCGVVLGALSSLTSSYRQREEDARTVKAQPVEGRPIDPAEERRAA